MLDHGVLAAGHGSSDCHSCEVDFWVGPVHRYRAGGHVHRDVASTSGAGVLVAGRTPKLRTNASEPPPPPQPQPPQNRTDHTVLSRVTRSICTTARLMWTRLVRTMSASDQKQKYSADLSFSRRESGIRSQCFQPHAHGGSRLSGCMSTGTCGLPKHLSLSSARFQFICVNAGSPPHLKPLNVFASCSARSLGLTHGGSPSCVVALQQTEVDRRMNTISAPVCLCTCMVLNAAFRHLAAAPRASSMC